MESRGGPHNCWCTAWINVEKRGKKSEKSEKKAAMKRRVAAGMPVGLLGYNAGQAIGWCAVAPRDSYRALGGDSDKTRVWSVVCFFIKATFRQQGLSAVFLEQAVAYARAQGGHAMSASWSYSGARLPMRARKVGTILRAIRWPKPRRVTGLWATVRHSRMPVSNMFKWQAHGAMLC